MAENSSIQWTTHTFNPWIGCAKVSPGCKHCYAETLMDTRYGRVEWGVHGTRVRTSPANWKKPLRWNRQAEESGTRARVFCASLADVFEDRDELWDWRLELFDLIYETPWLDWQLLTKRPELVMEMVPQGHVPDNVWIGTSVENQEYADARIPELLRVPARVRFLSCEPLLGAVDLGRHLPCPYCRGHSVGDECSCGGQGPVEGYGIDWVIIGGESGPKARPCDVDWVRSLVRQCQEAGVPAFTKQLGSRPVHRVQAPLADGYGGDHAPGWSSRPEPLVLVDRKGGESTSIEPTKSATEISELVQKYGGSRFEMLWGEHGRLYGIRFAIRHEELGEVPVRLIARVENIEALIHERRPYTRRMRRSRAEYGEDVRDTAYRVAWRQLKDFVEQSLLAVETGLFPLHEAFMAHVETPDPKTGETVTVGELFARHAVLEASGLRLLPAAPVLEGDYEIQR